MGPYLVYFWSDEMDPLEPVHVHVSRGEPQRDSTKIWLTKSGHALLCNNQSRIPAHVLKNVMDAIEARHEDIINRWLKHFETISYYC